MLAILLIPFACALLSLLPWGLRWLEYTTLAGTAASSLWAIHIASEAAGGAVWNFAGLAHVDALSAYILVIIVLLSFIASVYSIEYLRNEYNRGAIDSKAVRNYYLLFNLFVLTMMSVPFADNLAFLWISMEATTLVSALLVGLSRRRSSIEAAWKYIILCTVGITFALLGTFIMYYASTAALGEGRGTINWTSLNSIAHLMNPQTVRLAFILIMAGYGTKAGLAPVHNWLPDAHSEAPTPISALLSGILLNCAFYGVMRFASVADKTCGHAFVREIMVFFGLASVLLAGVFILIQQNAKRLLAYSSIEHMGIISISFGVGGFYGIYAALLHILNHAMGKPLMFFVMGRVNARYHNIELRGVRGVLKSAPLTGAVGFAGAMALAGMPPFNLFLSEFLMMRALADGKHWLILILFMLAGGLVFYGILKGFGRMFLGGAGSKPLDTRAADYTPATFVLVILGAGLLFLGLSIPPGLHKFITMSIGAVAGI